MYASLRSWINVPAQIKPFLKRDGTGAKQFGDPVDILCYPHEDTKLVVDDDGAEVVSTSQLYVDGRTVIRVTDEVIFDGVQKPIKRLGAFYRDGKVDIRVVYI